MTKDLKTLIILLKAHQTLENHVKKSLENTGLSVNEFAALEALHTKGLLTTQQLIDTVLIPNSSMTYVLDTLSKKGYIKRTKDENDKRIQRIAMTPLGVETFASIYAIHFKHMRLIFDSLASTEEIELQKLLKKLGKYAQKQL